MQGCTSHSIGNDCAWRQLFVKYGHDRFSKPDHDNHCNGDDATNNNPRYDACPDDNHRPRDYFRNFNLSSTRRYRGHWFFYSCAVCHGATGQGITAPALWGTSATLGSYSGITLFANNAQAMLTWISANMPFSAPGNLSPASQYTTVLCYILTQGNKVSPSTVFDATQLGSITVN